MDVANKGNDGSWGAMQWPIVGNNFPIEKIMNFCFDPKACCCCVASFCHLTSILFRHIFGGSHATHFSVIKLLCSKIDVKAVSKTDVRIQLKLLVRKLKLLVR